VACSTTTEMTCPQLALAAGVTAMAVWRWARDGKLGDPVGETPDGDNLYSVQALERHLGRRIDTVVLQMVLEVPSQPSRPLTRLRRTTKRDREWARLVTKAHGYKLTLREFCLVAEQELGVPEEFFTLEE